MKKTKPLWKLGDYRKGKGYEIINGAGKVIGYTDGRRGLWILDEAKEIWEFNRKMVR